MSIGTTFGERLVLARKEAGLTQASLAERLGIVEQTIRNYEAGRIPKAEAFDSLAKALNYPPAWFFLEDGYRLERDEQRTDLAPLTRVRQKLIEAEAELQHFEETLAR